MGRVAAPYGIKGWVRVQPFTSAPETLLAYSTWWLARPGGTAQACNVLEARRHGAFLIARLEGVASREEAAAYRGQEVMLPREALPEAQDDEVYLEDLVGLAVVNRQRVRLGTVAEVRDNGAQPVLRVLKDGAEERLIPFVPSYVDKVDLDELFIEVDWQTDY